MTDSSTEPAAEAGDKKVPVGVVAAERAKKRAAQDEAAEAKAELAKTKENAGLDFEAVKPLMEQLAEEMRGEFRQQLEAELSPWKQKAQKGEIAMQLGLTGQQADKVMEIKSKNPGLTDQQALLLATQEHPTTFPQSSATPWDRAIHGGMPVSGSSQARGQGAPEADLTAKMHEAVKNGDKAAAQHFAKEEFLRRGRALFLNRPRI